MWNELVVVFQVYFCIVFCFEVVDVNVVMFVVFQCDLFIGFGSGLWDLLINDQFFVNLELDVVIGSEVKGIFIIGWSQKFIVLVDYVEIVFQLFDW